MIITCIDFETANHSNASICAAGIAVFEDGVLLESKHWLIRPPRGHGWFLKPFVQCHGISHSEVAREPEFPTVAPDIFKRLSAAELVIAHNAQFDMRKLKGTANYFGLHPPGFSYTCTLTASRRVWPSLSSHSLDSLATHIGHEFRHHNAQEDAEAAGYLFDALRRCGQPSRGMTELAGHFSILKFD
jgi:DNA polymerase-3 subunit epsilon